MTQDLAPTRLASVALRATLAPLSPAVLPSLLPIALCSVFVLPLLTRPCQAKPATKIAAGQKVTQGVWGWTSGSQTYLRARPGAATPPVAKVPAHTKLFVWGKFNGWYRVETPDHTFGWVYHDYINANDTHRIAALSHSKAVEASDRTDSQTMYGSPELLKRHYALYGAPGAAKGMKKEGIRLAQAPKPAHKSAVRIAAKPVTAWIVAAKPVAKPSLVAQGSAAKTVRVAAVPKTVTPKSTPKVVSPRAAAPRIARAIVAPQSAPLPRTKSSVPVAPSSHRVPAPKLALNTIPTQRTASQTETANPVEKVAVPGEGMTSAPSLSAPQIAVAPRIAMRAATQPPPTQTATTPTVTITDSIASTIAPSAPPSMPVTSQAPRLMVPSPQKSVPVKRAVAPAKALVAPKPSVVAKAPVAAPAKPKSRWQQRLQWRQQKAKVQATRVVKNRQDLRRRMGGPVMMTPPSSSPVLAPISPAELLRAQQAWMASQGNQSTPDAKGLPAPEKLLTPSTLEKDAAREGGAPVAPITPASLSYRGNAVPGVVLVNKAGVGQGINRGGSPRDYARYNPPATNGFGNKLANQALGYRGMPYIYGSASPRRGFDCSGLIYFILRSRGYNPPRTAAGYARYGQAVPRDQLRSGDLLLFSNTYKRGISHIGIYMGEGKFVHAARPGEGVRVDSLSSAYYGHKFWGARRVPQK